MLGRPGFLSRSALRLALLAFVLCSGNAQAHRLDAQAFLLPAHQIQIEGWFSDGGAAKGARVQVYRADGQLLTEGRLNEAGTFIFSFVEAEQLKVVVSAGAGHRREVRIAAADLTKGTNVNGKTGDPTALEAAPVPLTERIPSVPVKDVLVGVGFLLALAAFVLSCRNARQLRQFSRARQSSGQKAD
jgi:nickel transport protein